MQPPDRAALDAAGRRVAALLPPTPTWPYPALAAATGAATVHMKHENVQPIGAFKVRGGLNLLATADPATRAAGVVGYSTGNHAQSLAYAARHHGVPCTVVMPADPNPVKAAAVRALGADLVEHGATLEDARAHATALAAARGARLVSAADEPEIIAGVATLYAELFAQAPELDVVLVPVGSGTGAAAACLAAAAHAPHCRVVAVQSAASPAAHDSWRAGAPVERSNRTRAEGLATGTGFALPQRILREHLDAFLLVDDEAITAAQWMLLHRAHTLAEGAGAAALAGLLAAPDRFAGQRVALVCTGANAAEAEILRCLHHADRGKPPVPGAVS